MIATSFDIQTTVRGHFIEQSVKARNQDGMLIDVMRRVVDAQDAQLRQALIDMGWTPPADVRQKERP